MRSIRHLSRVWMIFTLCLCIAFTTSAAADVKEVGATDANTPGASNSTTADSSPPAGEADTNGTQSFSGDGIMMDTVTITAIGSEQRGFESPYSTDVVSQQQIWRRQYRTLPQALRDVPGVMVQETAVGHGSPYIRGFTSFRNLFLIDGVRLNNSVFRPGPNQYWNTVDSQIISQLEVVKGPSSTLYGSDAIGGTVNARTISPYTYGQGEQVGGRAYYRGSTAEESHTGRGELSLTFDDRFGFVGGGTFRHFGDLHIGDGVQENAGYDEWNADFKSEYFLEPNVRLVFAYQHTRQNNVPRTHKTVFAVPFEGTAVGTDLRRDLDQERQLLYLQLHAEDLDGAVREVHVSVSWHRQQETRDRIEADMSRDLQGFDVDTFGIFVHAVSETSIGELTYGIDYYRDWVDSFNSTNPIQGPVGDDATYDLLGIFIQDRIVVSRSLEIVAGVRFTYARATADSVDVDLPTAGSVDEDWFNIAGNLRFVWFLNPERTWNIFGGVSQGFRAPNLSDLTRDSDFGGGVEQPALDLDPENYVMFEIGTKAQTERFSLQASFFHYLIFDQILRVPTLMPGDVFDKINSDDGFMQGIEIGIAYRCSAEVTVFGNGSWTYGEVQSFTAGGMPFDDYPSRLPPLMGQIGVRYEPQGTTFWIEGLVRAATDADKLSLRDMGDDERIPPGGTPGYVVASLRGGVDINEHLALTVGVENITDENYRVHGSGQNMPGVNLVVGVEGRF